MYGAELQVCTMYASRDTGSQLAQKRSDIYFLAFRAVVDINRSNVITRLRCVGRWEDEGFEEFSRCQ